MAYLKYRLDLTKKYDGTHSIFPFVTIYPKDNISGIYIFLKCAEFYMFMPVMSVFLSTICSSVRDVSFSFVLFLLHCDNSLSFDLEVSLIKVALMMLICGQKSRLIHRVQPKTYQVFVLYIRYVP